MEAGVYDSQGQCCCTLFLAQAAWSPLSDGPTACAAFSGESRRQSLPALHPPDSPFQQSVLFALS